MRELWVVKPGSKVDISTLDPGDTRALKGGRKAADAALDPTRRRSPSCRRGSGRRTSDRCCSSSRAPTPRGRTGPIAHVFRGVNPQGTCGDVVQGTDGGGARARLPLARAPGDAARRARSASSTARSTRTCSSRECASSSRSRCGSGATTTSSPSSRSLAQGGTAIIKCCLLISKDEQRRRFEERLKDPQKRWKFQRGDLEDRALWKEYQAAYSEAICSGHRRSRALVHHPRRPQVVPQLGGQPPAHRDAHGDGPEVSAATGPRGHHDQLSEIASAGAGSRCVGQSRLRRRRAGSGGASPSVRAMPRAVSGPLHNHQLTWRPRSDSNRRSPP